MIAQLILWSHALAALVFGTLAIAQLAQSQGRWVRRAFVTALFATAFWALAVAGIGAWDFSTQLVEAIRDLTWLGALYLLVRRDRLGTRPLASLYVAIVTLTTIGAALAAIAAAPIGPTALAAVVDARLLLRMMAAVGALVLVHQLNDAASAAARSGVQVATMALGIMWSVDVLLLVALYARVDPGLLVILRGAAMIGVGLMLAVATEHPGDGRFAVSRTAAVRTLSGVAAIAYVGITIVLTMLAERVAGAQARIVQTAIVLGAAVALLTLLSTPWLRAWLRVKLAKHLFRHRYDYRVEWQRFTATLGRPGVGAGLDERVVKAIADLVDAPAGLLLVPDGGALGAGAAWNWDASGGVDDAYARHLATGRIIEIDAVRAGKGAADADGLPRWMIVRADAWAIVPLLHLGSLVGAILLARPPVDRTLDWEDFDLLRVAGPQAASYLAEQRAQADLADAQRFDEFNRRFAFILHDVKNLVSQLTLVARNAERHADNPDFRADMVATLQDSAGRMNALLARLSQHHAPPQESRAPVDVAAIAARIAARTRTHPILYHGEGAPLALAQPGRLEQVLGHLIQNACEASAPGSPVAVTAAQDDHGIAIGVEDGGCGMTPAFVRDELFRPFVSSKPGGFGVGAFEAKQLVHAMGGTMTVTSHPGEGSCFRIVLPAALAMEVAA